LDRAKGDTFESFINAFYPTIAGEKFVPLGGMHDGGADAFEDERIAMGDQTGTFYQCSIQKNYRTKIHATVKRLRQAGRYPKALFYVTSQRIPQIDLEETTLSAELDVSIRIRDGAFISAHMNDSVGTRAAFETYLRPCLDFLRTMGAPALIPASSAVASPAVYVFLRQELDRSDQKMGLVNALADGLILWALEGTDPESGKFMTYRQITHKIEGAIPSAAKTLKGAIPARLTALATGKKSGDRPIRWHRKQDQYCLAYDFRSRLEQDNAADEALRLEVLRIFERRLRLDNSQLSPELAASAAEISLRVVQRTFELEGLEFAAFLGGKLRDSLLPTISDNADTCLDEAHIAIADRPQLKMAIVSNLQSAFYRSQEAERLLFSRLSATFTLLFCLNSEPRIVEYFQQMAGDFYLYVGADLLVRALTERYLRTEDQVTRNALRLNQRGGRNPCASGAGSRRGTCAYQ
jgi:hypothetical protein